MCLILEPDCKSKRLINIFVNSVTNNFLVTNCKSIIYFAEETAVQMTPIICCLCANPVIVQYIMGIIPIILKAKKLCTLSTEQLSNLF